MEYNWDESKNLLNKQKNGIDFRDAIHIFNDRDRIELIDYRNNYLEIRYQTIGLFNEFILFVVYTLRYDGRRIISARRARQDERKIYCERKHSFEGRNPLAKTQEYD